MRRPHAYKPRSKLSLRIEAGLSAAFYLAGCAIMTWLGLEVLRTGQSHGRISARNEVLVFFSIAGVALLIVLGNIKYILTGRSFPFLCIHADSATRRTRPRTSCPQCGYPRAGLPSTVECPECGVKQP